MEETPRKVLVVTPHPDDADFWCAGTIAKWIGGGATVRYVLCTDGGKGTTDPNVSSEELSKIREQEQADAVEILGVQELVLLHHPDGFLEDDDEFRRELVRQIRQVHPDVVLCPEPYRKNLAWHRDHRITGQVTLDAVFPCARDHLHFVELWRAHGASPVVAQYTDDFDETRDKDLLVFGSPATVKAEIERYLEISGTNNFVCRFAYGSLTYPQSRASLDLFAEEVMPKFGPT